MAYVYKKTVANNAQEVAAELETFFGEHPDINWKFLDWNYVSNVKETRIRLYNPVGRLAFSRSERFKNNYYLSACFGGTGISGNGRWPHHRDSINLSTQDYCHSPYPKYSYPCYLHILVTEQCLLIAQENFSDGYMQLYGAGAGCQPIAPEHAGKQGIWVGGCGSCHSYYSSYFEFFSTRITNEKQGGGGALLPVCDKPERWRVMGVSEGYNSQPNVVRVPALVHLKDIGGNNDYPIAVYGCSEVKDFCFPLSASMIFMPVYWMEKNAGGRYFPAWDIPYMKVCSTKGFEQGEIIQYGNEKWMVFDRGEVNGVGFAILIDKQL